MAPERSRQVEQLYHAARQRHPSERATFLEQACAGDDALRHELESLLAEDDGVQSFLETPALELMNQISGEEEAGLSMVGRQFGLYTVVSLIAKGGMGEVYRARDTQLQRDVALKLLPEIFASDDDRLVRFEREAQILAALNHPNIAQIYGLASDRTSRCIVMELVEGKTLEELLKRGPVGVKEALVIAEQVTEALEVAHEKGIIHRDLKPANVKVTPEGRVKVLDFGLAKPLEGPIRTSSDSPTFKVTATDAGIILGTAAYMSPEQARGEKVDKRTDIWALGCVLYELLSGKQAFEGETVTDTLAAILKTEPDWSRLPATTPAGIRLLLRRCLQKEMTRRLRDAADARIEIQDALHAEAAAAQPRTIPARPLFWRRGLPRVGALVTAVLIAVFAVWNLKPTPPKPVSRTVVALPPEERLVARPLPILALSPDGTQLAYEASSGGNRQLYLRRIDSLEARAIPGTEGARSPFFSPDGQWLGFTVDRKLKKVSVSGGAPLTIADGVAGSWGSNDMIVVQPPTDPTNLWQVSAARGTLQPLTQLENGDLTHSWPEVLPGEKAVVFTIFTSRNPDDAQIAVQSLETGKRKVVVNGGSYGRYALSGHLVYIRAGTLMAVPFDIRRLETTGPPIPVLERVMESSLGSGAFSIAKNGSLVYVPGSTAKAGEGMMTLVRVDRNGMAMPLKAPSRPFRQPRLSPDGRRLAVVIPEGKSDIWLYDLERDMLPQRLTFDGNAGAHQWTRDGNRLAFSSARGGSRNLYWVAVDGSGVEEQLTKAPYLPGSFTLDGHSFLCTETNEKNGLDIWVMPLDGDRKPRVFLRTPYNEGTPRLSPDDRYVAYVSDESGRFEVYIQPFSGPGRPRQVSTEGGKEIVWAANGELFYRTNDNKMMSVEIKTQPTLSFREPTLLFSGNFEMNNQGNRLAANYDVTPDGQTFIMLQFAEQPAAATQIVVVENWFEELKRRFSSKQ
jgi:serine/threonine protein kinase/Tol biopolymer transport system component